MGKKVQRTRSINSKYKTEREVKNSMGNGEAKELICMTNGHELRRGRGGWNIGGRGSAGQRGIKEKIIGTTVIV